jgi:Skp family chaperone for outer membrane proteins
MRTGHLISAGLLMAAVAALLAHAANGPGPSGQAVGGDNHQLNIAVINVSSVFKNMKESVELNKAIATKANARRDEVEKRRQEIQDLIRHREDFKPGSPQWLATSEDIDKKSAEADVWVRVSQLKLEREQKQMLRNLFEKIQRACEQIAQREKLDLVLANRAVDFVGPNLDGVNYERLSDLLGQQSVMYSSKKADITNEVLTLLDAEYARQAGGQAAGGH